MATGRDDRKPRGDSGMTAMVQAVVYEKVSAKFESVDFKIRLCRTLEDIVASTRNFFKVYKALSDTD